jgi:hypothetical protein
VVKRRAGRQTVGKGPPFREDFSTEAAKQPLLEVVTRKCLVKTLQDGKDLACVGMICKLWKSVLQLFIVNSCKWPINAIIQDPVCSDTNTT